MPVVVIAILALPVIAALLAAVTRMESALRSDSAPPAPPLEEPTPAPEDPRTRPLTLPIGRPVEPRRVAMIRDGSGLRAPR